MLDFCRLKAPPAAAALALLVLGVPSAFLLFTASTCYGAGGLILALLSALIAFLVGKLKLQEAFQRSLDEFEKENRELKHINEELTDVNEKLKITSDTLSNDVTILTDSIKMAGESRKDFMQRLTNVYHGILQENRRYDTLNNQHARLQLFQMFQHMDQNCDFKLSDAELSNSITMVRAVFPNFDPSILFHDITFEELLAHLDGASTAPRRRS